MKYVSGRIVRGIYTWLGWSGESGRANRLQPNQVYIPRTILPLTYFIHLPMKMEPIVSSETSAIGTQTPGNYPKRNKLHCLLALQLSPLQPNQVQIPRTILPLTYFIHLPVKMEPIVSSETSAIRTQTPGNYPKRNKLHIRRCLK